jgi:hypothetical protein
MQEHFKLVKEYLLEMGIPIVREDPAQEIVIVTDEDNGIKDMIIDCEEPILVLEQVIMAVPSRPGDLFKRLLMMNRELVHGAFVLSQDGRLVLFRDTLELEHLDRNELEASIQALGLALVEFHAELLGFAKR